MSHIHSSGGCDCLHKPTGTEQTLDELDWERGIWGAASNGDLDRLRKKLMGIGLFFGRNGCSFALVNLHQKCIENRLVDRPLKMLTFKIDMVIRLFIMLVETIMSTLFKN